MAHGPWNVKPNNVRKAIEAAAKAGMAVKSIIIRPDGGLEVVAAKAGEGNGTDAKNNPWDEVLNGNDQAEAR